MSEGDKRFINLDEVQIGFPASYAISLYNELKQIVTTGISRSNVVFIILTLMKSVEHYKNIDGIQKKALVLDVVGTFIDDTITNRNEADEMKLLLQLTLPTLIDTLVSLDTKEFRIKLRKVFCWCWPVKKSAIKKN